MKKRYVQVARESVSMYSIMGSDLGSVELQEILAVLIGNHATPELCGRLASKGIRTLTEMSVQELKSQGLTELKALELHSTFLLAKKLQAVGKAKDCFKIHGPEDAWLYIKEKLEGLTQEHFVVMSLNTKLEVISVKTVFIGSLNTAVVHPREVFKEGLKHSASSIMVFHNHPSGDPTPSKEDINVTKRLIDCGKIMGIELIDHIVVGDNRYVSLKEKGYFLQK